MASMSTTAGLAKVAEGAGWTIFGVSAKALFVGAVVVVCIGGVSYYLYKKYKGNSASREELAQRVRDNVPGANVDVELGELEDSKSETSESETTEEQPSTEQLTSENRRLRQENRQQANRISELEAQNRRLETRLT